MHLIEAPVVSNISFFPGAVHAFDPRFSDIRLMWLECPDIAKEAKPGQFVMLRCSDLTLPRPLSVHQVNKNGIAILYAVLTDGKGTRWLSERRQDDKVHIFGPLGNGFSIDASTRNLLLVAGGMGIASLYLLVQEAITKKLRVTLLLGARTGNLLYPQRLMPPGIELFTATEDGSSGEKGLVTSLISTHAKAVESVFACGPQDMYRQMAENRNSLGLENKTIQVSLEAVMGCGHGICYGCTVKTRTGLKQVCKDGPVFNLDDILWSDML